MALSWNEIKEMALKLEYPTQNILWQHYKKHTFATTSKTLEKW